MRLIRTAPAQSLALAVAIATAIASAVVSAEAKRVVEPRLRRERVGWFVAATVMEVVALSMPLAVVAMNRGRRDATARRLRLVALVVLVLSMGLGLSLLRFYQDGLGCGVYC